MSINASLTVHADRPGPTIQPEVYGHFAEHLGRCIYEGIWVGEDSPIPNTRGIRNDVVAALKQLKMPVLRWPGGCFADEYHWKDGIGPRENRPSMINTHWGGVVENNHFGTHEFLDLCEQIGTAPYICGNVGSGSPQEMMEWVEYLTSDAETPMTRLRRENGRDKPWHISYFGVGNESWGCGGNMRPEFYADNFRRFNTFVKNHSGDRKMYRIACGANEADYRWTEVLMENAGRQMNGLSLHHYTIPTGVWNAKGSATEFDETLWHSTLRRTLRMEELIQKHGAIMDRFDPDKRVGMIIDEWGTWYDVEPGTNPGFLYQQNTIRDALVAALNFHIFHQYADRVTMTNIAQTVNVLQTMILTDQEKMVLTPTYHVFEMFKGHQGGTYLPISLSTPDYTVGGESIPAVSASASRSANGGIVVSLAVTSPTEPATVTIEGLPEGLSAGGLMLRVLNAPAMQSHNTFDAPTTVQPSEFVDFLRRGDTVVLTLNPMSVAVLETAG